MGDNPTLFNPSLWVEFAATANGGSDSDFSIDLIDPCFDNNNPTLHLYFNTNNVSEDFIHTWMRQQRTAIPCSCAIRFNNKEIKLIGCRIYYTLPTELLNKIGRKFKLLIDSIEGDMRLWNALPTYGKTAEPIKELIDDTTTKAQKISGMAVTVAKIVKIELNQAALIDIIQNYLLEHEPWLQEYPDRQVNFFVEAGDDISGMLTARREEPKG